MKWIFLILGTAVLVLAYASENNADWNRNYKPLIATYSIYSGSIGEPQAPSRHDRKLSFIVEGPAAKEIFNAMPPDDNQTCSDEEGARSRRKANVWCTFNPGDGYTCYFGFDLRTGKSIAGGIC